MKKRRTIDNLQMLLKWGLLFLVFSWVVFVLTAENGSGYGLLKDETKLLEGPWTVTYEGNTLEGVALPTTFSVPKGRAYSMETTLPQRDEDGYLLLRVPMQRLVVRLDGEVHYTHPVESTKTDRKPLASLWVLVPLAEEAGGKTLELTFDSDIEAFSGLINTIRYGQKSDLLFQIIKSQGVGVLIAGVLFVAGLMVVLLSVFLQTIEDKRFQYLGFLSIFTSLWILSESRVLQFLLGNRWILGSISYVALPFMGYFFVLFVKETMVSEKTNAQRMQYMALGYLLYLQLMILLQLLGRSYFIETTRYFFYYTLMVIFISGWILLKEAKEFQNTEVRRHVKYLVVVLFSILLELLFFYLERFDYTSFFLRIGILYFLAALFVESYLFLRSSIAKQKENQLLETMAYKDFLTGGANRAAYDRDLQGYLQGKSFRMVLLDMNHLKRINDEYGHASGDEAIVTVYETIEKAFYPHGQCYRLGGDEFVVLLKSTKASLYEEALTTICTLLAEISTKRPYTLEVAAGSEVYEEHLWLEFKSFYHEVDQKMYQHKTTLKNERA